MSALISNWIKDDNLKTSSSALAAEKCLDSIKEYFHCTICHDSLNKPIQTKCGHIFCSNCIQDLCKTPAPTCPLCKVRISNRSLIVRDDVDEMMNILMNRLSNVLAVEMGKYLNWKEDKCKKQSTSISSVKAIDNAPTTTTEQMCKPNEKVRTPQERKKILTSQSGTSFGNQNTCLQPSVEMEVQKPKEPIKAAVLEKMRNQEYVIMSSGIEVAPTTVNNRNQSPGKPLDLSLTRRKSSQSLDYKYTERPTTIHFIKPLDLSMKKEKRKFEDVQDNCLVVGSKNSRVLPSEPSATPSHQSPRRKRGKFEDKHSKPQEQQHSSSVCKQSTTFKAKITPPVVVEDVGIIDFDIQSIFTPTPPAKNDTLAKQTSPKEAKKKTQLVTKIAGPSQYYDIASEIMKDFDVSFEDDVSVVGVNLNSSGKVTSSDELLGHITDESLLGGIPRSQTTSDKSQADAKKNKDKETFVFKPPSGSITTQAAKKKQKNDDQGKKEDVFTDFVDDEDDEFQHPRDSDFLFRDMRLSGLYGKGKSVERDNNFIEQISGQSNKESKGRRSLSRIGSSSRTTTPVKPKPSTSNEERTNEDTTDKYGKKSQKQVQHTTDDVACFEDDDEDENWLLDVDMPLESQVRSNGKRNSGKLKQPNDQQAQSLVDMPQNAGTAQHKQRFVFCPTRLTKPQTIKLQELCKMCDGIITKDFTLEVSHLVINLSNGRVPQTLKYLLAIAGRKWVVIYDWVEKCLDEGALVSEAPFETSNFKQCDPGVKRSRLAKRNLFDGFKFFFATEHYKSMGFTKEEVMKLMDTLGATVVITPNDKVRDLIIIGSLNGNSIDYNHWLHANKWVVVTFEWVIECILEYQLKPFEAKHLCGNLTDVKSINAPKSLQSVFTQYLTQRQMNSPA